MGNLKNQEANEVDKYIAASPAWAQGTLRELRAAIHAAAPEAKESISYRMPYYSHYGRLAYFGAYTNHCSFHWISDDDKRTFAKELARVEVVGSTLRIPRGTKTPVSVIKKIVRARAKANEAAKRQPKG